MDDVATAEKPGTNYARVRDTLRLDIVDGLFAPGQRLKIAELAERYGVSTIPIREALQQLQGEGLVLIEPNRGATVRQLDEKFLTDLYDVRELIEAFQARRFLDVAAAGAIDELEAAQAELEAAVGEDALTRRAADRRFHLVVADATHNQEAAGILERQANLIGALVVKFGQSPARYAQSMAEHRALIAAFRRGDGETAARVATLHVRNARIDIIDRMRRAGTGG